ncbi:hypothetical protein ACVHRQ_003469, partial [Acinetobacter baumannii]
MRLVAELRSSNASHDHGYEIRKVERTRNLLAELNKNGEAIKLYDYNGNELKTNFLNNEVYFS